MNHKEQCQLDSIYSLFLQQVLDTFSELSWIPLTQIQLIFAIELNYHLIVSFQLSLILIYNHLYACKLTHVKTGFWTLTLSWKWFHHHSQPISLNKIDLIYKIIWSYYLIFLDFLSNLEIHHNTFLSIQNFPFHF